MSSDLIRLRYASMRGYSAPMVSLDLFHNRARTQVLAYVDSGALYSVFKSDVAERLGFGLTDGTRILAKGLNGKDISIYLHHVGLRLAEFQFTATIGFSDQLGIGFNLLGRHSVFNQLQFCFNDRDGELIVSRL